jgi:RNA polymerase sigma-70 factor (ECF subfamily)
VAQQDFAVFFEETWTSLAGYGHTLTGDPTVGDDLAQEALARVYARYALLREPRAYAFRVVTNLAKERWKRLSRERAAWEGQARDDVAPGPDGGILDAVQRLRAGHREVLLLHYWGDMTVEEVAAVLRRPTGTVKRWLTEARASLSEAMNRER